MQKNTQLISRLLILPVFGVFCLGLVYWEATILSTKSNSNVLGVSIVNAKENSDLIISQSADESNEITVNGHVIKDDARPLIIKKYLEKYNSPLAPYSDLIFEMSELYGFDYYWIVAIAQQESNLCKKAPEGSHNCWGYGIHKRGTKTFDSYELAIKSYAEYLKTSYFDIGLNTPELIMKKYCPSSNGSWAAGVTQFINELESGNF